MKQQPSSEEESADDFFVNVKDLDDFTKVDYKQFIDMLDVRVADEYYRRIIVIEYSSVFLALFGIALSVVMNELHMEREIDHDTTQALLSYITISSLMLAFAQYLRYDMYLKWYTSRQLLTEFDTMISTGWWREFAFETAIIMLQPYPFLQGMKYYEVNVNWNITTSYEVN